MTKKFATPHTIYRNREEVVKRWVAALRSGEYKQHQKALRSHAKNSFCCLGVLCDLAAKDGGADWYAKTWFLGNQADLPVVIARFIVKPGDEYRAESIVGEYAKDNDFGASFSQLADRIEKELL